MRKIEKYAPTIIAPEEIYLGEVEKMLRQPGDTASF